MNASDDHITVYVRVLSDDTTGEYNRCIEITSRTSLNLIEISSDQSSNKAFEKKDKIRNSPPTKDTSVTCQGPINQEIKRYQFSFHHIFYENEHLNDIWEHLKIDIRKNNCIICIGKSDTIISKYGLIIQSIKQAFDNNYSIEFGCVGIVADKITSLTNGYQSITNYSETFNLLYCLDYFNPRKLRDEVNVCTMILTKDTERKCIQFTDVNQNCRALDFLKKILTNVDYTRGGDAQAKDPLVQMLTKSICFGGKITVIGNISPIAPFMITTRSILFFTDCIEKHKDKNRSAFIDLLLKEVRKLQKSNLVKDKKHSEISSQVMLLKDQLSTQYNIANNSDYEKKLLENELIVYKEAIKKETGHTQNDEKSKCDDLLAENAKKQVEIEYLRIENSNLQSLVEKIELEKKNFEEKYNRVCERYAVIEKDNSEYIEKIRDLRINADQS